MTTPRDRRPAPATGAEYDYSATVLGSHWVQRPDDDTTKVDDSDATMALPRPDTAVLRFGPGVTAALSHGTSRTLAAAAPLPALPNRRLRRHTLPALVLIAALVFLFWRQHSPPSLSLRDVTVTTVRPSTGCDGTADVVGVVRTDGHGELSYRWIRNDGTSSAVHHTTVARGRHQVRVHLLWTFQGHGHYAAGAELRVLSPGSATAKVDFTYDCP
ncbi:hypothetical protein OG562_43235 [Streptomyces sp. NBC_01275]|uniref:hypothetical protein n=1 Tax=Streptomyces sp. NBC_01275 TaxID=2903807 RepID=UPI0022563A21|nr:hypothetical protein [Streptomyces sp. NBC_01275]MCX4767655.1 hypothetical protein [Streptomyces sp. NBC_01275]